MTYIKESYTSLNAVTVELRSSPSSKHLLMSLGILYCNSFFGKNILFFLKSNNKGKCSSTKRGAYLRRQQLYLIGFSPGIIHSSPVLLLATFFHTSLVLW